MLSSVEDVMISRLVSAFQIQSCPRKCGYRLKSMSGPGQATACGLCIADRTAASGSNSPELLTDYLRAIAGHEA